VTKIQRPRSYLHKEKQIRILALWGGPNALLDVVGFDINTLGNIAPSELGLGTTSDDELTIVVLCRNVVFDVVVDELRRLRNCTDK
jgi:hypothetical protein